MVLTRLQKQKQLEMAEKSIFGDHESDEEPSMEEILKVQHDTKFQRLLDGVLAQDPTKFFLHLASLGVKLPKDYDVEALRETNKERIPKGSRQDEVPTNKSKATIDSLDALSLMNQKVETLQQ